VLRRTTALLGLSLLLAACGPDDGRHLAEPDPALTAVPVPTTQPVPIVSGEIPLESFGPGGVRLSSPAFSPGATMPDVSGCGGELSPPLVWTAPPRRATELALVAQDLDGNGTAQWVVTGISPSVFRAPPGRPPRRSHVELNSAGVKGWASPCPSDGFQHRIDFRLYLLDGPLQPGGTDARSVVSAIQAAAFGSASIIGRASPAPTGGN